MASKLFELATKAVRRQVLREFSRTPIGRVIGETRRFAGRRGSSQRFSRVIRQLSPPEVRQLVEELEKYGPASLAKYGLQHEQTELFDRMLRLLGPVGDVIKRVIGRGRSPRDWSTKQVESAKDVIRAFGGEVLTKPGESGYERGIDAAKRVLSEIATPPPVQPPIARHGLPPRDVPTPPDRPTIGNTGISERDRKAADQLQEILTGKPTEAEEEWPEEQTIQTLGRGMGYDADDDAALIGREIRVKSSNVYSFVFERESHRHGILYVTFLAWHPGATTRSGPGPTYAYYDVPMRKYKEFEQAATTNSAGKAVWDYLRVRGSVFQHQHQYRIVAGTLVQDVGEYVPRKATAWGLRKRAVPGHGVGRRGYQRSQLPERARMERVHRPNRGRPNRGEPNRGQP